MQGNLRRALASTLGAEGGPVFLAGFNPRSSELKVHVRAGCDTKALKLGIESAIFEETGQAVRISVRAHSLRQLAHPRSLEHWEKRFGADDSVYDPTMILSRARTLIAAAKACRTSFGGLINGIFFDADRRALFVLARGESDAAMLAKVRSRVSESLDGWLSVQVGPELPRRKMVPVDTASASWLRGLVRGIRRWFAPVVIATLAGIAVPAAASPNVGKVENQLVSDFGVLAGLSLFSDGQLRQELDAFAAAGLQRYFGASDAQIIRLAQQRAAKKKRDPDEVGQVPAGPGS